MKTKEELMIAVDILPAGMTPSDVAIVQQGDVGAKDKTVLLYTVAIHLNRKLRKDELKKLLAREDFNTYELPVTTTVN